MMGEPDFVPDPEPETPAEIRAAHWYSRIWNILEEPRSVTAVQIVFTYWAAVLFGFLTLVYPPRTVSASLGEGLVYFISSLMILSGVVGTFTAALGWLWVERIIALGFLAVAWLGYFFSVGEAQVLQEGSRWLQIGFLSTSLSGMITRFIRIRRDKYGPGIMSE